MFGVHKIIFLIFLPNFDSSKPDLAINSLEQDLLFPKFLI